MLVALRTGSFGPIHSLPIISSKSPALFKTVFLAIVQLFLKVPFIHWLRTKLELMCAS